MAKRSPETFLKRQREMEKRRKAAEKRKRRKERKELKADATPGEGPPIVMPEPPPPEAAPDADHRR